MSRVLALNTDGQLTYCTAPEELRGKGRCNHIFHQNNGESKEDFLKRVSESGNLKDISIVKEPTISSEVRNELLIKLSKDENTTVRVFAAREGINLEELINDESWAVRAKVAQQGYGLDKLVNDENADVRAIIAQKGLYLDKLVNDKDYYVRKAVAKQGYDLEKLANDESWIVRAAALEELYKLKENE